MQFIGCIYSYFYPPSILAEAGDTCIYFIREKNRNRVKIGKADHPDRRIKQLQTGNSDTLLLEYVISNVNISLEVTLHKLLKGEGKHIRGEWFRLSTREARSLYNRVKITPNDEWCII